MTSANAVLISDQPLALVDMGIDTVPSSEAAEYFKNANPSVVGLVGTSSNWQILASLCSDDFLKGTHRQFFLVDQGLNTSELCQLTSRIRPRDILQDFQIGSVTEAFHRAFEDYRALEQDTQLSELINEKNNELKRLSVQLEKKVEDRQKQLELSLAQSQATENRLKLLNRVLVSIFQAQSISQIEQGIFSVLKKDFSILGVQIRQSSQSNPSHKSLKNQYRVSLRTGPPKSWLYSFSRPCKQGFFKRRKEVPLSSCRGRFTFN